MSHEDNSGFNPASGSVCARAYNTACPRLRPQPPRGGRFVRRSFPSRAHGVGHPIEPLSDMRRADARSAQIGGPDFIGHSFQVNAYSGEPFTSIAACNLFAKDR